MESSLNILNDSTFHTVLKTCKYLCEVEGGKLPRRALLVGPEAGREVRFKRRNYFCLSCEF